MLAAAVEHFGERLELKELDTPEPGPGEIRVRLGAAGMNPIDGFVVSGSMAERIPHEFPLVPGQDGAGTVDLLGEGATRFAVGDRVFGVLRTVPLGHGTYAQYVVIPETVAMARTPEALDDVGAAALPTAGLMALQVLDVLGAAKGARILVMGATGGIGMVFTQIAAARGVAVIASARQEVAQHMREMGAVATVDHTSSTPLAAQVHALLPGGVDAIAVFAGTPHDVAEAATAVRPGGRVAATSHAADPGLLGPLGLETIDVRLAPESAGLEELARLVVSGGLVAPIEATAPLAQAADELAVVAGHHAHGKRVLIIP